jgi:hypothetical protein
MASAAFTLADQDAAIPFDYRGDDIHSAIIEARNA